MENNSAAPSVAGWHDDPEDPNFMRYSNGRSWAGERVAKDRSLNLGNANVYRPGGNVKVPKDVPKVVEAPAPSTYQPMTRRERRALEEAQNIGKRDQTIEITDDFEFQSAAPVTRSYVPVAAPSPLAEYEVPETVEKSEDENDDFGLGEDEKLPWEDDFESSSTSGDADDDAEDDEPSALPSLDFDTFAAAPAKPEADEAEEEVFVSELPSLDLGGAEDGEDDVPELPSLNAEKPEPKVDEQLVSEFEAFMDDDEDTDEDESSDKNITRDEDEFISDFAIPSTPSYAKPAPSYAAKVEPKKAEPVDEKTKQVAVVEPQPEPDLSLADILDEEPETVAKVEPVSDKEAVTEAAQEPSSGSTVVSPVKVDAESETNEDDEDEAPAFGFKSKLDRNFQSGAGTAHDTAMASVADPAPAAVDAESKDDDAEDDDDDEMEDDQPREGFGSKLKSLFGRGRSKEVLDEDEDEDNDSDEDEDDNESDDDDKSESRPSVKQADDEDVTTPAVATVESTKEPAEAESDDDAEEEDDDEDEDEGVEREEPQLRAGLFASRKEKEDAAVEGQLLDRLKELADRVAALKKEEVAVLARIETAKAEEAELAERINHAHEEHELLDQLAKARQKELENTHSDKDEDHFRNFIETHEAEAHEAAADEDEITISAPASDEAPEDEDDDAPETTRLPELKLN